MADAHRSSLAAPPRPLAVVLIACSLVLGAHAQTRIRAATKDSPPFAYRDATGAWVGISIDLWHEVAAELNLPFDIEEVATPEDLVDGVQAQRFDVGISAVSVTAARESRIDFSHPYFSTGLGIAVRKEAGEGFRRIVRGVLSWQFLTLIGSVVLALLLVGWMFWLVERRVNPVFESRKRGVSAGLWWATIMLLGHKGIFPVTAAGRVLAASSMVVSILLLSVLTGAIASALTLGELASRIRDYHDLRHARTAAIAQTSAADFLRRERISFEAVPDLATGLRAVADGRVDALVHDAPLLDYAVLAPPLSRVLRVLPQTFALQDYAIALQQGSDLREPINNALLEIRASPRWQEIRFRYSGR